MPKNDVNAVKQASDIPSINITQFVDDASKHFQVRPVGPYEMRDEYVDKVATIIGTGTEIQNREQLKMLCLQILLSNMPKNTIISESNFKAIADYVNTLITLYLNQSPDQKYSDEIRKLTVVSEIHPRINIEQLKERDHDFVRRGAVNYSALHMLVNHLMVANEVAKRYPNAVVKNHVTPIIGTDVAQYLQENNLKYLIRPQSRNPGELVLSYLDMNNNLAHAAIFDPELYFMIMDNKNSRQLTGSQLIHIFVDLDRIDQYAKTNYPGQRLEILQQEINNLIYKACPAIYAMDTARLAQEEQARLAQEAQTKLAAMNLYQNAQQQSVANNNNNNNNAAASDMNNSNFAREQPLYNQQSAPLFGLANQSMFSTQSPDCLAIANFFAKYYLDLQVKYPQLNLTPIFPNEKLQSIIVVFQHSQYMLSMNVNSSSNQYRQINLPISTMFANAILNLKPEEISNLMQKQYPVGSYYACVTKENENQDNEKILHDVYFRSPTGTRIFRLEEVNGHLFDYNFRDEEGRNNIYSNISQFYEVLNSEGHQLATPLRTFDLVIAKFYQDYNQSTMYRPGQ